MQLRRLNLYPRLLLIFCCLLIASTAFITLFNQASYARELESSTVKYRSALVQNAMYKLQQQKEGIEENLSAVLRSENVLRAVRENQELSSRPQQSAQPALQKNRAVIESALLSARRRSSGIRALVLVSAGEQYSASDSFGKAGGPVARDLDALYESEIYQGAVKERGYPFWRDSVHDTPTLFYESETSQFGIPGCVTLSYQVYDLRSRVPLGVLICCISPGFFTDALREYSTQDGGNTFIIGENGLLEGIGAGLSAPPFPRQRELLHQQVFARTQGGFTFETDDKELLVSFCGDPSFPIRVVNLTYRDWVLRPAVRQGQINLLILIAVIVVGAFGFYVTAVSVAYPVNRLIRTMKRVGDGDLDAMYQAVSRDEIGTLCREFDRMVSDMKELIDRVYVSESREKELELAEKNAQLDALQMQVNPHFLYNTLDLIRWQCLDENGGESPASDMIEKFCVLLRMTIKGERKKESIGESLLHAETYLEVVNFRYKNKISLHTKLDFEPDAYQIPCLSLQPIIENAVRHGFPGGDREGRVITVCGTRRSSDTIVLTVSDNGCGMDAAQLERLRSSMETASADGNHIGLRNVNQRCKLCYGGHYGIEIESTEGVGTSVRLTLPAQAAVITEEIHSV